MKTPCPDTFKGSPLKDIILLSVKGSLNATVARNFEKRLHSVLLENEVRLVIGLRDVHYVCAAGWVVLLNEINGLRHRGGDLVLAGMKPGVSEAFRKMEFDSIFKCFPDVGSAFKRGFNIPAAGKNTKSKL